ncbi:sugar ABC transporter substrate-binding protein [Tessaracoccus rhinocerotis]|uniref:Sugar ABC transporter substrate-binding protein n=2 Tax=Tessaracoccus rhinocerotis TaxID=1689449 RepID=A0A553K0V3_9ACTN|nr:sugar ABC transporter substrate-binding protein [Tessaracoccus rhinocerotis]
MSNNRKWSKKMRIKTGAVAALLSAAMMLVGCSGATEDPLAAETTGGGEATQNEGGGDEGHVFGEDETLIGGSIFTLQYAWFLGAQEGMEQWGEEHPEANVKFQFEDSQQDIQTNIENLENLVSAGAKGIVVFPTDAKAIIPTMVDLHSRTGTQFVVGDYPQQPDDPADAVWNTFVGHDMTALGEAAGQVAVDYLDTLGKDDPTLLFITVPTSGQVSADRFNGFSDVVTAAYPNATILEEGDSGAADRNSAQSLMENVLQREATIDVVAGHNDAEVIGAYNAAVGAGRDGEMKFIGIAGDKEVLQYIQDGNESWIGEVLQDPVVLGYTAMDALWKSMAEGEELPETYDLPAPEAITPDNIGEYDWQNWTWLG